MEDFRGNHSNSHKKQYPFPIFFHLEQRLRRNLDGKDHLFWAGLDPRSSDVDRAILLCALALDFSVDTE